VLPDGSGLLVQVGRGPSQDIGVLRVGASFEEEILLGTPFEELEPSISPDGKSLAYVSDESGRREVYVRDFPGPGRRWDISAGGGDEPLWAPSGRELFYRNGNQMMVVPFSAVREPGTPLVLFEGEYERDPIGNDARNYDVSSDGTRFLMVRREVESDRPQQQQLNVVLNWFEELKRLDPNR
jgi:serine/threonine-protein kinase